MFELCRSLKTDIEISHIPIILLTARGDVQSSAFGYKMGADNYIPKPFDVDFLLTIINNELRNRDHIRKRYQNLTLDIIPEESTFSNADEKFLNKLNSYIHENRSNEKLDLKIITTHMGMSRTSFQNKMKVVTNTSIRGYINMIRISKAKHMLEQNLYTVAEVADLTDFSGQSYFSTIFKQYTGSSPSQYIGEKR